jgi:hypothetical protein
MSMDRRTFLKAAAAAPCIFGLRELFAQESDKGPEWYRQALARMKERKLHGVVVIVPERVEPEQLDLGRKLWDLLDGDFPEAHELFLTGVFVVMTPALAESSGVRKPDDKADRILLDPDGKRVAADTRDPKAFETAEGFVKSFGPFLHGDTGERLKPRADELLASAPVDVLTRLRDLAAEDIETRERATGTLAAWAEKFVPVYTWKRRTATDPEVRARLLAIIEKTYRAAPSDKPGARLPFGTRVPTFAGAGCGGLREVVEGEKEDMGRMVACGMARVEEPKIRMFLRFLAK